MTDMMHQDVDPQETKEWIDALESVLEEEGVERAHYLLEKLIDKADRKRWWRLYFCPRPYLSRNLCPFFH